MKVEECVRDALQEIGQQAAEQPVQPDEMATGIRYLNRMMLGIAYLGLGYTVVTSASNTMTIPTYAEEWVVLALAKRLIPQFPSVDPETKFTLNENLKEAWNNLLKEAVQLESLTMPSTLPIGSGNEDCLSARFYPEDDNNILQESGDNILLEDDA